MSIAADNEEAAGTRDLDRRRMLGGTTLAVLGLGLGEALAQTAHQHAPTVAAKTPAKGTPVAPALSGAHGRYSALAASSHACVVKGEACLKHCLTQLKKGDTSLVDCMKTVQAMLPICRSLERYAVIEARHLLALSQLTTIVNKECEVECRKHAEHHATCKACAEACLACIAECNKLT